MGFALVLRVLLMAPRRVCCLLDVRCKILDFKIIYVYNSE